MKVDVCGGSSFSYLKIELDPNEEMISEPGAMSSMDYGIDLKSRLNGSLFRALILKFLGKESLFINRFFNTESESQTLYLTQKYPGQICQEEIDNEPLYIQPGAFIACTPGVRFSLRWAGFSSWLGGEGLFRLLIRGKGSVWYGAYGAVVEKEVIGDYIVDNGHLLAYPKEMKLSIKLAGGIFSSLFGGEGLVLRLKGSGKIKLQTRSLGGLAGWLNPRFRG